jgi:hypothetical protein
MANYEYPSGEEMKKMLDAMLPKLPVDRNLLDIINPKPEPKPFAGGYPLPNIVDDSVPLDTIIMKRIRITKAPPIAESDFVGVDMADVIRLICRKTNEESLMEGWRQQELKDAKVIEQGNDGKWRKAE